jgi:hypothetical protein
MKERGNLGEALGSMLLVESCAELCILDAWRLVYDFAC